MGLLDFLFGRLAKNKPNDQIDSTTKVADIPKDEFVDDSEPTESATAYSIDYGSKLPIDIIYGFLKEDYEAKAYQDALTNPDKSYKETNLAIIRSNLEVKFKQVLLKYEDMLRDIDFHIESRGQAGLTDLVDLFRTKKETYIKHIEELNNMKIDLDQNALYMVGIFKSYEVGFTRGLASLSLHNLKIDNIS